MVKGKSPYGFDFMHNSGPTLDALKNDAFPGAGVLTFLVTLSFVNGGQAHVPARRIFLTLPRKWREFPGQEKAPASQTHSQKEERTTENKASLCS
jgi:hypothetical protein